MPELPEITARAKEMREALLGKTIAAIEVLQPKSLNIPEDDFVEALTSAEILDVTNRGKWLFLETTRGWLLLNLGMGGEILLVTRATLPEKYRLVFDFEDGNSLSVNFWWFGYAHYTPPGELETHRMTAKLGSNATDLSAAQLGELLSGRRGRIKNFLLDQTKIAGIGNAYIHDILFLARLHPMRQINTLNEVDIERLWQGIQQGLQPSIDKGGAYYEVDIYGAKGGFTFDDILIGYREGQPCPVCGPELGTEIEKIKTGSNSSFICPECQKFGY
ncbi:MAG: DNA-formamidopyrimidine glycosylase family protein [Chloroflexota bacterium]|nr:DNA-formamidopyrimidine glycosylase family protein [Chloroflexota bacterium]